MRNTPRPPVSARVVAADNKVNVFWHTAGGPTRGFNVYRSTSIPVALTKPLNGGTALSAKAGSFVDRTAHNATTYRYVVVAVGVHSLRSKPTSTLTARPLPAAPTAPPAPRNVDASADSGQINVKWTSGGGSTSGFNIYRSTSSKVPLTNPINDDPLAPGVVTFTDTVSDPGTYYYVVQAISAGGSTSRSETAQATFGGADIKVTALDPVLFISRNGTTTGQVQVSNFGDATLTVTGADLSESTAPATYFSPASFSGFSLDRRGVTHSRRDLQAEDERAAAGQADRAQRRPSDAGRLRVGRWPGHRRLRGRRAVPAVDHRRLRSRRRRRRPLAAVLPAQRDQPPAGGRASSFEGSPSTTPPSR